VVPSSSSSSLAAASSTAKAVAEGALAELIDQGKQHVAQLATQIHAVGVAARAAVQDSQSRPYTSDPVKAAAAKAKTEAVEAAIRTAAAGLAVDVLWFACQRVQVDEASVLRTQAKAAAGSFDEYERRCWFRSSIPVTAGWVNGQWKDLFLCMAKRVDEMPGRFLVADWTDEGQLFHLCSHATPRLLLPGCL
jgi:hypothetical protein